LLDIGHRDSQCIHDRAIHDPNAAGGDRTHGEFLLPGNTQFPHEKYIEWRVEDSGYFERNWNTAAGQAQYEDVISMGELTKPGSKDPASLESILKQHWNCSLRMQRIACCRDVIRRWFDTNAWASHSFGLDGAPICCLSFSLLKTPA
jgi:hypothetical protein